MTMTAVFGPQLIGQTEKTLQALLRRALAGTGLTERHWVALRLAAQPDGSTLRDRIADQAKFDEPAVLVTALEQRGLLADDTPTTSGRAMLERVTARSAELSGTLWDDIDGADTAARALTVVLTRARAALDQSA
jgi:hypothetical protein